MFDAATTKLRRTTRWWTKNEIQCSAFDVFTSQQLQHEMCALFHPLRCPTVPFHEKEDLAQGWHRAPDGFSRPQFSNEPYLSLLSVRRDVPLFKKRTAFFLCKLEFQLRRQPLALVLHARHILRRLTSGARSDFETFPCAFHRFPWRDAIGADALVIARFHHEIPFPEKTSMFRLSPIGISRSRTCDSDRYLEVKEFAATKGEKETRSSSKRNVKLFPQFDNLRQQRLENDPVARHLNDIWIPTSAVGMSAQVSTPNLASRLSDAVSL